MVMTRPENESAVAAMFDRVAPRYDLLNRLLSMRQDERWRTRLATHVPYRPGGAYLDVATGTADVLIRVARTHPEYTSFVGTDISPGMLAIGADKCRKQIPGSSPEFRQMSAEKLAFSDGVFDAVSISFGLRNVVNKPQALREMARVLKPGGTLLILEFFLPKRGLMAALFQFYFKRILPVIGGWLSDRSAYKYLPESVGSFYSAAELRQTLSKAGLIPDATESYLFGATRLVKAVKP